MPKKTLAIIGILILAAIAIGSAILFYQLRQQRISPIRPETPEATSEGIIWNEAIDCVGGNVSLGTIPDWQSILLIAEVNPSSWVWGNQTQITVQGHIAWQFPGDNQPYHEYPTKTYTKPADCPGTTPTPTPVSSGTPTPTPTLTPRPSVTPTPTGTPTVTTTASPTPTPTPTSTPPVGGLPTPTPTTTVTTSTPVPTLPPAGTTTPTILAIGGALILLIMAVALAI